MPQLEQRGELLSLSPDEFEDYVAELWEQQGYVTERTQHSHDYGVDVFAHPHDRNKMEVIQAKRNKPGNTVGGPTIQQLSGAREQYDADRAVVVTTSSFTSNAKTVANAADVELIDGDDLTDLHRKYNTNAQGETERFDFSDRTERIAFWLIVLYWGAVALYIVYQWGGVLF